MSMIVTHIVVIPDVQLEPVVFQFVAIGKEQRGEERRGRERKGREGYKWYKTDCITFNTTLHCITSLHSEHKKEGISVRTSCPHVLFTADLNHF